MPLMSLRHMLLLLLQCHRRQGFDHQAAFSAYIELTATDGRTEGLQEGYEPRSCCETEGTGLTEKLGLIGYDVVRRNGNCTIIIISITVRARGNIATQIGFD